ncbi:hypothetical protein CLOM_g6354 [Closterium sp. NIES-68]|nr:hypothetical protein CLOM_g6354 [Closterium sp. NIES-68]GJP64726.1 hypothetical protein CLOP_g21684 [Closterium sp. NIES-67]
MPSLPPSSAEKASPALAAHIMDSSSIASTKHLSFVPALSRSAAHPTQPPQLPASTNLLSSSLRFLPASLGRVFAVSALLVVALSTVSQYRDLQAAGSIMAASSPFPVLPPLEVRRLVEDEGYIYLDVRTAEEFAQVHVAGSDLIPYLITAPDGSQQPNPGYLAQVKAKYALDTPLVVACRSGRRSNLAALEMMAQGFTNLVDLAGGIIAWEASGLPVVRQASKADGAARSPVTNASRMAG